MPALEELATAWERCVSGDVAGCMSQLSGLPSVIAQDPPTRTVLDRVMDDIAALLPQRFESAAGIGCEAACLDLLHELSDRGLLPETAEYQALGAALMHGLRYPIDESDLPAKLVAHARRVALGPSAPGAETLATWENPLLAFGAFRAAFRPARRPGFPGNAVGRAISLTARARLGAHVRSDREKWLGQAHRLLANEITAAGCSDADPRAQVHLSYQQSVVEFHSALLRDDQDGCRRVLHRLAEIGVACGHQGMREESWAFLAFAAGQAAHLSWDNPQIPVSMIVDAQLALYDDVDVRTARLEDIINAAALPRSDDGSALSRAAQKCWTGVRETLAALRGPMPAASRWRAANAAMSTLSDLPVLSLLDPVRWNRPKEWADAMLPVFYAHPYEWRTVDDDAIRWSTHRVRAMSLTGAGHIWHVNADHAPASVAQAEELNAALWQSPPSPFFASGPDNIIDPAGLDASAFVSAGLFPVIREFNRLTRSTTADPLELLVIGSQRLENLYARLAQHPVTHVRPDELTCAIGALAQVPWELAWDRDSRSVAVCLEPRSPGFETVRIPEPTLNPNSRVAVFLSGGALRHATQELESIRSVLGADAVATYAEFTAEQVAEAAATCDILHYITHGEQSWSDARKNVIGPADRRLKAEQIARLDLSRVQMVVLNACDAAASGPYNRAGDPTFVGAFLAAGSRAVITNLWSVEDTLAATFSESLYRELAAHRPLIDAFVRARQRMRTRAEDLLATTGVTSSTAFLADPYKLTVRGQGIAS